MGSDTTRRRFLKWTAMTGVAATGSATSAVGESGNDSATDNNIPDVLPKPQRIEKRDKSFPLTPVVTLVASSSVDPAALREVKSVLQAAGVRKIWESKGSDQPRGPLTIYVGKPTKSPHVGEALDRMNVTFPNDLPDEGYVLATGHASGGKQVVLAGTDDTGTFHAAQTLRQLVMDKDESEDEDEDEDENEGEDTDDSPEDHPGRKRLPGVAVTDFPDLPMRGVVEGFYGGWSHEDRLRQLKFYGNVKNNIYIYAPKGDPYHRDKWREPYPSEELDKFKELIDVAQANHVEFTFSLSPGVSICYSSETDYRALVDKFQTMYDLGVRTFSIPLDDISYTSWNCDQDRQEFGPPSAETASQAQVSLLNRVQREFIETHEGASLQMVPTEYYNVSESSYKQILREKLDDAVTVMWTGIGIKAPEITQSQAQEAHDVFGHDILVWDNYPINESHPNRLFLGPVTGRDSGLDDHGLVGLTPNPMPRAEASKPALATAADYTWNGSGYGPEKSWKLGLRLLGNEGYNPLYTFAKNTRSTPLNRSLSESPELTRAIDEFWPAFNSGEGDSEAVGV